MSTHLTRTAWVRFPPSPTHEARLLCSAMSGLFWSFLAYSDWLTPSFNDFSIEADRHPASGKWCWFTHTPKVNTSLHPGHPYPCACAPSPIFGGFGGTSLLTGSRSPWFWTFSSNNFVYFLDLLLQNMVPLQVLGLPMLIILNLSLVPLWMNFVLFDLTLHQLKLLLLCSNFVLSLLLYLGDCLIDGGNHIQ